MPRRADNTAWNRCARPTLETQLADQQKALDLGQRREPGARAGAAELTRMAESPRRADGVGTSRQRSRRSGTRASRARGSTSTARALGPSSSALDAQRAGRRPGKRASGARSRAGHGALRPPPRRPRARRRAQRDPHRTPARARRPTRRSNRVGASRQDLEARLAAQRSPAEVTTEFEAALDAAREELRAVLEAHGADRLAWETERLEFEKAVGDLQSRRRRQGQAGVAARSRARAELADARCSRKPPSAPPGARAAVSSKPRSMPKPSPPPRSTSRPRPARCWPKLERLWDMDVSRSSDRRNRAQEIQRAIDAHAAEITAWETTRQHVESELQEALLDAHGQRSRHRRRARVARRLRPAAEDSEEWREPRALCAGRAARRPYDTGIGRLPEK